MVNSKWSKNNKLTKEKLPTNSRKHIVVNCLLYRHILCNYTNYHVQLYRIHTNVQNPYVDLPTTLLSAKMALLCLSADIPHVGIQKDNLDWSGQNTIDVHDLLMHYLQTSFIYFYSEFWYAYVTMCIATHVLYVTMCIATRVYLTYVSSLWETRVSYVPYLYQYSRIP